VSIDLTELVYLQKMDKSYPSWAFQIIPITDILLRPHHGPLVLLYPLNVLQTKHKQPNFHKQQNRTFTSLIVLLKAQTIK
jgi:hypothetical protein